MYRKRGVLDHYSLSIPPTPSESPNHFSIKDWLFLLLPFVLVAASIAYFTWMQPKPVMVAQAPVAATAPKSKEFTIDQYLVPEHGVIQLVASNNSDEAVTIPQVIADDAYWKFDANPSTFVPPGGVVTFTVPYPWVEGELPEMSLITSHGKIIASEVEPTIGSAAEVSATTSVK